MQFLFLVCLFLISRLPAKCGANHRSKHLRDLCEESYEEKRILLIDSLVRWSFLGGVCCRGRCIRLFHVFRISTAWYQVGGLEVFRVDLLMCFKR